MNKNIKKLLCLSIITSLNMPSLAGVYNGALDDATFAQLLIDVSAKSQQLDEKVAAAKLAGITTDYAQVSQVTIKLFKDTFAPWDRANPTAVQAMYDAKYFTRFDPVGAEGLPFDELADCLEVADAAIAELEAQMNGDIVLQTPPNFKTGQVSLNGENFEIDGQPFISNKFFWQPMDADVMEAFGYSGEQYYSAQFLSSPTSAISGQLNRFERETKEQISAGRTPFYFFLGHIVPNNHWSRTDVPAAYETGYRVFTNYDIDNPSVRPWLTSVFDEFVPVSATSAPETARIHMIANEPTFAIREGGVANDPRATEGVSSYTMDKYGIWLAEKYGSIASLNSTYGTSFDNFEAVKDTYTIPLAMSYQGGPVWYDWHIFNMERVNSWFKFLHDGVHAKDPNAKTHIKVLGERSIHAQYQDEGIDFEFITKLVDVPGSDAQTTSKDAEWDFRLEQEWRKHYTIEWRAQSIMLDFMKSIAPDKPIYDSEWHGLSGARWRDFHMSPDYVRTALWLATLHGVDAITAWVWNRDENGHIDTRADFVGTTVTQPIQLDAYGRVIKEINAHGKAVTSLVPQHRNFLMYYSKDSAIQDNTYTADMADVYEALKLLNVSVGFTTPTELTNVDKNTQTVILSPTAFVSQADLNDLADFVAQGGRVVLVEPSASFGKTELGATRAQNQRLPFTPFATIALGTGDDGVIDMANHFKTALTSKHPNTLVNSAVSVEIKDTNNNEAYGVLVNQYFDSEQMRNVVSLMNISKDDRIVNLALADGVPNDIVNLISSVTETAQMRLQPYDVVLLGIGDSVSQAPEPVPKPEPTPEPTPEPEPTPKPNPEPEAGNSSSSGGSVSFTLLLLIAGLRSRLLVKAKDKTSLI